MNKCKIIGYTCLLQGNIKRCNNNYIQYLYSYVPPLTPGGGGWSLMVFSLGSLYEDYDHLKNIWTKSNAGLPLARFKGATFTLYQDEQTDYIFTYDSCWPMVDTPHTHADSSPFRMLQKRHKITVPSRQTKRLRKGYKKVKIHPPSQMYNKWYFQKDICNTPLVLTTTTAVSLTHPFADPNALSNVVTFYSLNTFIFQNINFQHFPETTGYSHKTVHGLSMYLYATTATNIPNNNNDFKNFCKNLIFLGNTKENVAGLTMEQLKTTANTKKNWGNPFHHRYLEHTSETSYNLITTKVTVLNMLEFIKETQATTVNNTDLQFLTGPLIYTLQYNPFNDTGLNKIYFLDTSKNITLEEPENENLIYSGFPFYNLLWGWADFIKKLKIITNLNTNGLLVAETKIFNDTTLKKYIFIDKDFIDGYDPYQAHDYNTMQQNYYNSQNWFPRLTYQEQTINTICLTGPACPRPEKPYLQAIMKYKFYFTWGGCPKQLEKAYDPCLQSKWPTPDNLQSRLEITNPNQPPETELYSWDWEKDYVTESAIERIQQYTTIDESLLSSTETKWTPKALKKTEKDTTAEKEEKNLFHKLLQLRKQRMHLELQCQLKIMELQSKNQK